MTNEPDLDELTLVRSFRSHLAEVPDGLQQRIEERLWQDVLAEETRLRTPQGRTQRVGRHWWSIPHFMRQGALAVVATSLVVVFAVNQQQARPSATDGATQAAASDPLSMAIDAIGRTFSDDETAVTTRNPPLLAGDVAVVFEDGTQAPLSHIAAGPSELSPEELDRLPSDEAQLLGLLRAAGGRNEAHGPDFDAFGLAGLYMSDPRVPVRTRVAVMRMLRYIDGVSAFGGAVDVFGRPGVAVSKVDLESGLMHEFLLDERSGRLLQHTLGVAIGTSDECPPDTVVSVSAYDSTGFVVAPDEAPYGNWPQAVPECDPAAR